MRTLVTSLALFFLSTLTVPTEAQTPTQADRVVIKTNLVSVNVIVTDKDGRYIKGLTRDQFELFDENAKQQLAMFSAEGGPVSLGIVLEVHEGADQRTKAHLLALKQFVGTLRERDRFFFSAYTSEGSLTTDFVPTFEVLVSHLHGLKPGGAASLYDAVYLAASRIRQTRNLKKALLIISDGDDTASRTRYQDLRNRLREFDVQIYAIGIADPKTDPNTGYGRWVFEDLSRASERRAFLTNLEAGFGRAVLAELARATGGSTYFPNRESEPELVGICAQIATELREQYTLGFYPVTTETARPWHRLKIKLTMPQHNYSLFYREGYRLFPAINAADDSLEFGYLGQLSNVY